MYMQILSFFEINLGQVLELTSENILDQPGLADLARTPDDKGFSTPGLLPVNHLFFNYSSHIKQ